MTKFALVSEFAPPDHGGIQATVGPIIEALGDEVTVIAPQAHGGSSDRRIVRSLFSSRRWPHWWWLVSWLREAKSHGLQTVIFGHYSAAVISGLIAKKFFGLDYVVLIHGNDLLTEERRWLTRWLVGSTLRQAKGIGVNSAFVERLVTKNHVPLAKIVRTHPFVLSKLLPTTTATAPSTRFITVSRLVARKNVAGVLQALAEVEKKHHDVHLDIVGDGPEQKMLETLSQKLGLSEHIAFHGAVDEVTKWKLLHDASTFVMAPLVGQEGTDVEGLGLVYLEAAACGLPVIASRTGGVEDAVIDQQTGLLVDPEQPAQIAQAMNTLIEQPELAKRYGQAGKNLVLKEFTDTVRLTRLLTAVRGTAINEQPKVSVIIPTFNAANTIGATLRSVKDQSWKNLEIIVVDDGSTDELDQALKPYLFDITVVRQKNSGAPAARNRGFDLSQGEYVMFLDADIVLEPEAITKMMVGLKTHPQIDFVYSDFYFGWKKFHLFEYSPEKLRQQNYIHTSSLIRRDIFPRFDEQLTKFQDWDLWLTLSKHRKIGLWLPEVLFRVTQRDQRVGMSTWLPSFMYKLPLIGQGRGNATIAKYRQAEAVIRQKHGL